MRISDWSSDVCSSDLIPIGRPIADTSVYILNSRGEPVPTGVVGELHVGGEGVARGYLGRTDLTAERFVPDAFGLPDGRLYRTVDRVRYLPDGSIEFVGRDDHQVQIRGFRIDPGEHARASCRESVWQYVYTPVGAVFFKQKTAYDWCISDWSSDVCSSDLES